MGDAVSSISPTGSKLRASVLRTAGRPWSSRPSSRRSGRRSSARDVARRATASRVSAICRNCSASSRPPRTARPTAGAMSWAAPTPTPGRSRSRLRAWSVSSSQRATRTGSSDGTVASARRRDGGNDVSSARRATTAGYSSRARERSSTSGSRHGPVATHGEPPRAIRPVGPGVVDADTRRHHDVARRRPRRPRRPRHGPVAVGCPDRTGPCPSTTCRGRAPHRRGPARWPDDDRVASWPADGDGRDGRPAWPRCPRAVRSRGSSTAAALPSGPVTTLRQSYMP